MCWVVNSARVGERESERSVRGEAIALWNEQGANMSLTGDKRAHSHRHVHTCTVCNGNSRPEKRYVMDIYSLNERLGALCVVSFTIILPVFTSFIHGRLAVNTVPLLFLPISI